MYAICRVSSPREIRRYGGSGTMILFCREDDAWAWIRERPELLDKWYVRQLDQDDWKNKMTLRKDMDDIR